MINTIFKTIWSCVWVFLKPCLFVIIPVAVAFVIAFLIAYFRKKKKGENKKEFIAQLKIYIPIWFYFNPFDINI